MKKDKKIRTKIINLMFNISIFISLIMLVIVINSRFIKKDRIVSLLGKSILVVTTESMKPTINAGDLIIISKENQYDKNDIVTFFDEDVCVTHRIVEIDNYTITTKGDANNVVDKPIVNNQIVGKVVFTSHILGIIVLYYLKPTVFLYFTISLIILIIQNFKSEDIEQEETKDKEEENDNKENE